MRKESRGKERLVLLSQEDVGSPVDAALVSQNISPAVDLRLPPPAVSLFIYRRGSNGCWNL